MTIIRTDRLDGKAAGLRLLHVALIFALCACFVFAGNDAFAICGDTDGDGVVTQADAELTARAALGTVTLTANQRLASDVAAAGKTPDGKIMSNDFTLIADAARGGKALVCAEQAAAKFAAVDASRVAVDPATGGKYVTRQIVAILEPGAAYSEAAAQLEASGAKVVGYNSAAGLLQVELPDGVSEDSAAAAAVALPQVAAASRHWVFSPGAFLPNDPPYADGALAELRRAFDLAHVPDAWAAQPSNIHPIIANIDTGIDGANAEFAGRIAGGADFISLNGDGLSDAGGHGTAIAGIEAAAGNNGFGIAGVCWDCRILSVRACDADGVCPFFAVMNAVVYAADSGADVINISIEGAAKPGSQEWAIFQKVIDYASARGAFIVAAAGNRSADAAESVPAGLSGVFAVAAADDAGGAAAFSNFGAPVKLYAPGVNVYTIAPGGAVSAKSGTSISAAFVSGAAGLLKSRDSSLTAARLEALLRESADPAPAGAPANAGRLNVAAAAAKISGANNPPVISSLTVSSSSTSIGGTVSALVSAADPDGDGLSMSWEASGGTISGGGTGIGWIAPADMPGEYVIKVTINDGRDGLSVATAQVSAGLDGLLRMEIFPRSAVVPQGVVEHFSAFGVFADGSYKAVRPVWSVEGGIGIIDADGAFTSLTTGQGAVRASLGGKSAVSPALAGVGSAFPSLTVAGMTNKNITLDSNGVAALVGEITGDTKNDIVVITGSGNTDKAYSSNSSIGNISLTAIANAFVTGTSGSDGKLGDIDADGDLDLVESDSSGGGVRVFKNNGSGTFTISSTLSSGDTVYTVDLKDMDNDGAADVLAGPVAGGKPVVYWNNGSGTFTGPTTLSGFTSCALQHAFAGDTDNDGRMDVVRVCESGGVSIENVKNQGGRAFAGSASAVAGSSAYSSTYGVLTNITSGDDNLDLIVLDGTATQLRTFSGNGDGTFTAGAVYDSMAGAGPVQFDAADASGDGAPDILTAPYNAAANKLWKNNGSGGFANAAGDQYAANVKWGALGDLEGDGDTDLTMITSAGNAVWINDAGNPMNLQAPTNLSGTVSSGGTYHLEWDATADSTPLERMTFDIKAYFFNGTSTSTIVTGKAAERDGLIGHATRTGGTFGYTLSPAVTGSGVLTWAVRSVDSSFYRSNWSAYSSVAVCPVVSSTADTGNGTLRDCMDYANLNPGTTITFSQSVAGGVIQPESELPQITAAGTVIDGGSSGITIDGSLCGSCSGITINGGDNSTIKALRIKNFSINGIFVSMGGGVTIGGSAATDRNYITNNGTDPNTNAGINLDTETYGATIRNNYVGVEPDGATAGPNIVGIMIKSFPSNPDVGSLVRDNLISGNTQYGVYDANGNLTGALGDEYYNNIIGLAADGTTPLPNSDGIYTDDNNSKKLTIGAAGDGNTISCNTAYGVYAVTVESLQVFGNRFGTNVAGTSLAPCADPQDYNIYYSGAFSGGNIGGDRSAGLYNVIGGASEAGIRLKGVKQSVIQGNYIGTGVNGTENFGNGKYGIWYSGLSIGSYTTTANKIGDSANTAALGNTIAYNGLAGIYVDATGGTKKPGMNEIYRNSIYSNGGATDKGIMLASGAHGDITVPQITSAVCAGTNADGPYDITIQYNNPTSTSSTVYLYGADNTAGSPSVTVDSVGGEGYRFIASVTGATGSGTKTATFSSVSISNSKYVSAYRNHNGGPVANFKGFSEFGVNYKLPKCTGNSCPDVSETADSGDSTLRDCMDRANSDGGPTNITFSVSGTISVTSTLPSLTEGGTTIDGAGIVTVDGGGAATDGFVITSANNTIKGLSITNFASAGVFINGASASGNTLTNNNIGVSSTGAGANKYGVVIAGGATNNTVGGDTSLKNVISSNTDSGIRITGTGTSGNTVRGNYLGTSAALGSGFGNAIGIKIESGATGNNIGGTSAGQGNTIAYSTGAGVALTGSSTDNNSSRRNSIHSNGGKGFTLDGTGSNDNIAAPAISSMAYDGVKYDVNGTASCLNYPCVVELFLVDDTVSGVGADPSGSGEAYAYVNAATVSVGTAFSFASITIPAGGTKVTAALTDSLGNTSEFGANYTLPPQNNPPAVGSVTFYPTAIYADGADSAYATATVSDTQGVSDIATVTINLSSLGGSAAARMYDDGLHNDGAAGDGVFGIATFTVPYGTAIATYTTTVTAYDAAGLSSSGNGSLGLLGSTCPKVRSSSDSGMSTLRECITLANASAGADAITFDSTLANATIDLASALPSLTGGTISIVNNNTGSQLTINGGNGAFDCIKIQSANNSISRLTLVKCGASGSQYAGVHITGASSTGNTVQGSYIGTNSSGSSGLGNGIGVRISSGAANNTIDGTGAVGKNIISGNYSHGLMIGDSGSSGNTVKGNNIGLDASGVVLANGGSGVYIYNSAASNNIGGTTAGAANTIAGNTGDGIGLAGASSDNNSIRRNLIYKNGGLGIKLAGDGANNDIAAPSFTSAVNNGSDYSLTGTAACPAYPCQVELYRVDDSVAGVTADGSGAGEGYEYLNTATISSGTSFSFAAQVVNTNGSKVTATVTSSAGNTSQFSANRSLPAVNLAPTVSNVTFNPTAIAGDGATTATVTASISDPNGYSDIMTVKISMTPVGGAATVTMYDDGLHGDGGAGDSLFGATVTAAFGTASGTYTITVTAFDSYSRSATANGSLIVTGTSCPVVNNASDNGLLGTLRDCINNANSNAAMKDITFSSSLAGRTLTLASALPAITRSGTTITNNSGGDIIVSGGGGSFDCFTIGTSGVTLTGLSIVRCGGTTAGKAGVKITGASATGNSIRGCNIGTDASSSTGLGNSIGIYVLSSSGSNSIDGTTAAGRNVISGNVTGIDLGGVGSNTVTGNYIGTNRAGTSAQANSGDGIIIETGSVSNTIGGTSAAQANVISGNGNNGLYTSGGNNNIYGNYIGTNATGSAKIANQIGIQISGASGNKVGGTSSGMPNVIAGSSVAGVHIGTNSFSNTVYGNYIGTNSAGASGLGNAIGVQITSGANLNSVGGTSAGQPNTIVNSTSQGVRIDGATTIGNTVSSNRIYNNGALGIDLTNGSNRNVVSPSITKVINYGGSMLVAFTVNGAVPAACSAAKPCRVEIFSVDDPSASPAVAADSTAGEGYQFATYTTINTCAAAPCYATLTNVTTINANSTKITATVTSGDNDTSEFANNYTLPPVNYAPVVSNVTFTPASVIADGTEFATLTAVVTDANGASDIASVSVNLSSIPGATATVTMTLSGGVYTAGGIKAASGTASNTYTVTVTASDNQFVSGSATGALVITGSPCPRVKKTTDSGLGNLRDCIGYANSNPGTTITFDSSLSGGTFTPATQLPDITAAGTKIDGGSNNITISGSSCTNCHGLVINNAANADIKGLTIVNFAGTACDGGTTSCAGVRIKGASATGNTLRSNYIGTNSSNSTSVRNSYGVLISNGAANNTVGGTSAADANTISNNTTANVLVTGAGSDGNKIYGNFIGTNASGGSIISGTPATVTGVSITGGAKNTVIGSTTAQKNIVAGSTTEISVSGAGSDGTIIKNNYIGTNAAGSASLTGGTTGIYVTGAANTVIGGDASASEGNTIAGAPASARTALKINSGTTGTIIRGNNIGVLANGTTSGGAPAGSIGILLQSDTSTTVGGTSAGYRNVIGANPGYGIQASGSVSPLIYGNFIGTSASASASLGNGVGIFLTGETTQATVGGAAAGMPNTIINNTTNGISASGTGTSKNTWRGNLIYKTGGVANKGILVTSPANSGIAVPVIQYVRTVSTGTLDVSGTSTCAACTVEVYRADDTATSLATDTAGGEGYQSLTTATTAADGSWVVSPLTVSGGQWLTAIITDANGNSSEFAANKETANSAPNTPLVSVSVYSLLPGSSTQTLVTVTASDPNGPADLSGAYIDLSTFNPALSHVVLSDTGTGAGVAGDGIFTASATVAAVMTAGVKTIVATVTDSHGLTASGIGFLNVLNATPTVSATTVTPSEVIPGYSPLSFGATVSDLNDIGDIAAVSADFSSLGGSSTVLLYDDGAHSDGAASDGVFMRTGFTVPAAMPYGTQTVSVTVTDKAGATATKTFSVYVNRPSSLSGMSFSPSSVAADNVTTSALTLTATDPESLSEITSVTVNLSQIGGGAALLLYDNGLSGDGAVGDGVFGRTGIKPTLGKTPGAYTLVATLTDKWGRTATTSAQFTIVPATPLAPTGVSATSASATVTLKWTSPAYDSNNVPLTNLAGHKIFRKLSGGSYATTPLYTATGTATATQMTYSDSAVTVFKTYCYYVTAFDTASNTSAASSESCVDVYPKAWVYAQTFGDQTTGSFLPPGSTGIFSRPTETAIDSAGNLFVTDTQNHRIQKFASDGTFKGARGAYGTAQGNFKNPSGITYNPATGFIYVTDSNNRIQVFDTTDAMNVQTAKQININLPMSVTAAPDGTLYVTTGAGEVKHITTSGGYIGTWTLSGPRGVGISSGGTVYTAAATENKLYKIGAATATVGSLGSGFFNMDSPYGVAVDAATGYIFIADMNNDRVLVYDSSFNLNNIVGSSGSNYGQLRRPTGVKLDSSGNLYVTDNYNNRVQKFSPP